MKLPSIQYQHGITLIVSLVMLLVVLMLSTSLASMALMGEKAARNERDKQVAMQAAESALVDAELDIENSTAATSRSEIFSPNSAKGFVDGCGKGDQNIFQGLCTFEEPATWLAADFTNSTNSASVQFGRFTGNIMPTGHGPFPAKLPRYIIELMDDPAAQPTAPAYMYRITAIGFGADSATQVVLQSFYRKSENLAKESST